MEIPPLGWLAAGVVVGDGVEPAGGDGVEPAGGDGAVPVLFGGAAVSVAAGVFPGAAASSAYGIDCACWNPGAGDFGPPDTKVAINIIFPTPAAAGGVHIKSI